MFVHPILGAITDSQGVIYAAVRDTIVVMKDGEVVGYWVDSLATGENGHNVSKKLKSNEGAAVAAAVATGGNGIGAPVVCSYVRNLMLTEDESRLVACVDSDKSLAIFDINRDTESGFIQLVQRQKFPKRPNALAFADNDTSIIVADKFGDVYKIPLNNKSEVTETKEDQGLEPILGHVSMLTDVVVVADPAGKNYVITADRDEHIKVSHYPQTYIVDKWLFGHGEFVSSITVPKWDQKLLISAGGDEDVFLWDWVSGELLSKFTYTDHIKPYINDQHLAPARFQNENNDVIEYGVAKVSTASSEPYVAFFIEATKVVFILRYSNGTLELAQKIDFNHNVISLASGQNNSFIVTLDNRVESDEELLVFISYTDQSGTPYKIDEQTQSLNNAINEQLKNKKELLVDEDSVFPLYNITSLKKHGEHFS
ncbi:tRNA (guanine-N(7)-)-methyltransferase non-catalytic subunit TRM82 [Nakaseomyces bracarensis]|uniref:tRNA (Guanine-N(7)-)-methyltransferase non-catalytic subunit TRM82 n=1 Tax=Nakaseomyces bracarensis TaxID=273131 RepID=A0ABR4NT51_9SACH